MESVPDRRAIIEGEALMSALADLGHADPLSPEGRSQALALLRGALDGGRAEVRRGLDAGAAGTEVARANCELIDHIVRALHDFVTAHVFPVMNPTAGERLGLVGVGGYGRGELAPFSDVDLLFLLPYKRTPWCEQVIEYMLYMLWDLGLKVGHATRSVRECIRLSASDIIIRTSLLEARYICGDQALYEEMRERFLDRVVAGSGPDFVEAKLAERDARHHRMGDSRYLLEPNIKDGKGGLRDLHTLFWIAKYLYRVRGVADLIEVGVLTPGEHRKFLKAEDFLWTVRCHLHDLAGRPEERLTFDVQPEIGRRLGYTDHAGASGVERFMKHYFLIAKNVGDLTRIFCAALEAQHKRRPRLRLPKLGPRRRQLDGFLVEGGRLTVAGDAEFAREPVKMIHLFHVAEAHELDIHPRALRLITRNLKRIDAALRADAEANRLFMEILTSPKDPETALRRMNEAGVLGRFIPDFGRVVAQTQHDMYHVYTVDEHTIRAIGILARIERGELRQDHPLADEIIHKVLSRRVLYLGVLLHDIAKGRGGNHSAIGAQIALKLGARLGLTAAETETTSWLVKNHLAMSATAFKRDIGDPKTVEDFVATVQSPERLRLLLVLTVADIRAVGPGVWNGWKGQLLRDLYFPAEEAMTGGHATLGRKSRVASAHAGLARLLADWSDEEFEAHIRRGGESYWLSADAETLARQARFMRRADRDQAPLAIDARSDRFKAVTEVAVYTADHPGLFAQVAGAMAVSGANIVEAKIFTTSDGAAIDTFLIQDAAGGAFEGARKLARLEAAIQETLEGRLDPRRALAERRTPPTRARVFTVAPQVFIDNVASDTHTVIEVNGRDRPGFLYDVTRTLADMGLMISSARVTTYGERAVDVFYVKDVFGLQVTQEGKCKTIRERLLAVLDEAEVAPPLGVAKAAREAKSDETKPRKARSRAAKRTRGGKGKAKARAPAAAESPPRA